MKRIPIIITLFMQLLATSYIFTEEPENGSDVYHELVDSWLNEEIDSAELIRGINDFESTLAAINDTWEKLYWLSRTALIRGQIHYENKDKEASLAELFVIV